MRRSVVRSCWFGSGCPVLRTDTRENPVGKNGVMTVGYKRILKCKESKSLTLNWGADISTSISIGVISVLVKKYFKEGDYKNL